VNQNIDALTGLPNRMEFLRQLEAALAVGFEERSVLFIDLDRFQQINSALGYAKGDTLLQIVAMRLQELLGDGDLAGRVGGDEFAILTAERPERFLKTLRAPYPISGNELFVTASIGVANFPWHGRHAAELLCNADLAMSRAKSTGRDTLEVFAPGGLVYSADRLHLENALRRALENRELHLVYQPVVNMDETVDGLEALLSWRHPNLGVLPPRQFIHIAEETGLIVPIGAWVMEQACIQGAQWIAAGYSNARISVNVSGRQFERSNFVAQVANALCAASFPPDRLELELTESYLMRNLPESIGRMHEIRELGVSISIDDFGTGYSSLSHLSKLPVDTLKIDQSFLRRLLEPRGSLPVVQSIIRLAHSMQLNVVAEGVETESELDLVRVLGCDKVQGHVYGPAMGPEEASALLRTNVVQSLSATN